LDRKAVVFGWSGLVGSYAARALEGPYEVVKVSRTAEGSDHLADGSGLSAVKEILSAEEPDIVMNAVKSPLSTDQSERMKSETWAANVTVAENLASLQKEHGYLLVHISTDWVYEGKKGERYTEDSIIYPQNFYSFTKAIAEERVRSLSDEHLILRPTGIFGIDSRAANFFMRVQKAMEDGQEIKAPSDQLSHPIYAGELARLMKAAIDKGARGTFNCVGKEYLSRNDLALMFCEAFGWDKKNVSAVESSTRDIRIPRYLDVDMSKFEKEICEVRSLRDQLADLKKEVNQ